MRLTEHEQAYVYLNASELKILQTFSKLHQNKTSMGNSYVFMRHLKGRHPWVNSYVFMRHLKGRHPWVNSYVFMRHLKERRDTYKHHLYKA